MSKSRVVILVTAAVLVGLGVGLLLPRPWALANPVIPPTPIALQLDLRSLLEDALPARAASSAPGGMAYVNQTGGLAGKLYAGLYRLKGPSGAGAVHAALLEKVEEAIEGKGGNIHTRITGEAKMDDKTGMTYFERGYRLGGRPSSASSSHSPPRLQCA